MLIESADMLPPDDASEQTAARMCFLVGELGLLFPRDDGREVIAAPPISRVPNTISWLRGLANVRGELIPVVDTAAALGATHSTNLFRYLLIFGRGDSAIGLSVEGLPRLFDMQAARRLPELPDVPSSLDACVLAAYEHAGHVWLDVDLDSLFERFARQIAAV